MFTQKSAYTREELIACGHGRLFKPENARLPLLALTTLSSDTDRARAANCGFQGYEVKLDRERFLQTVAELITKGERASTS